MENKIEDYDKAWIGIERPSFKCEKLIKKKAKIKKAKKVDRLDDMKTVGNVCIMLLKFCILLNLLVITGRML
ncbi:MAG: hypothetical protein E6729_10915 [Finegoldia magna]|nr:hypothetical protein [Finegoldia magna]